MILLKNSNNFSVPNIKNLKFSPKTQIFSLFPKRFEADVNVSRHSRLKSCKENRIDIYLLRSFTRNELFIKN